MRKRFVAVATVTFALCFAAGMLVAATGQGSFERLAEVRSELVSVKAELGMYSCCIAPSCNFCALATGMCPCGDGAQNGDGVCGECLLGWEAGYGNIAGVDAGDVEPLGGDMLEMMYRSRAESTPDAAADAGTEPGHHHAAHGTHGR